MKAKSHDLLRLALLGLVAVLIACSTQADNATVGCNNGKAKEIYNANLDIIESRVNGTLDNIAPVHRCIVELERITGIESESNGHTFGRYSPTKNDAARWKAWFAEHKQRLCYDPFDSLLYVRK